MLFIWSETFPHVITPTTLDILLTILFLMIVIGYFNVKNFISGLIGPTKLINSKFSTYYSSEINSIL